MILFVHAFCSLTRLPRKNRFWGKGSKIWLDNCRPFLGEQLFAPMQRSQVLRYWSKIP